MIYLFSSKLLISTLFLRDNAIYFSHTHAFSSYAGGHSFEEEANVHDLPYGYEVGDDPFEPSGQGDYPWLILFIAGIAFVHFSHAHFHFHRRHTGEVMYH